MKQNVSIIGLTIIGIILMISIGVFFIRIMINTIKSSKEKESKND